ncbi:MAG: hypothetical protein HY540_01610 [Deltaproteobacteria bacterium]|nr:hypothetical protein [Deltaproteobacteria bacterium]
MKRSLFLILLTVAACGGAPGHTENVGSLSILVKNARSFSESSDHERIANYRVTVTGKGFEPIQKIFSGDQTEGVISGIPAGDGREVAVEALNGFDQPIRGGEAEGVDISGGDTATVDIALESIPIFTNLTSGKAIENTRLVFRVLSDADDVVEILDKTEAAETSLVNPSNSLSEISLSASKGRGELAPTVREVGKHTFSVRSLRTGRKSEIELMVTDGTKSRPAPLFAAENGVLNFMAMPTIRKEK